MVFNLVAAANVVDELGEHVFSELHEVVVVSICHVKFENSELRVVSLIDTLVSEDSSDFVDSVKTSDDEHLRNSKHIVRSSNGSRDFSP